MPGMLPIPEKPQHGVGKFEANKAWGGLAGLRFSWETSLGWFLPRLGIKLGTVPAAKGGGAALNAADTAALFATGTEAVLEQIGHGLTATQSGVADADITHSAALLGMASQIAQGARDTVHVKQHVTRRTAPKVIVRYVKPNVKAIVAPYAKRTAAAEAKAEAAERRAALLEQRVARLERKTGRTSAVAIPGIEGRLGEIDRVLGRVEGKVRKLGKAAGIGAFLLLLAKALEKMGANWIRCSNVKRYGRSICGMNTNLLEGLLADALLIASLVSIVEFAKELQGIEAEVAKGIRLGVKELKPGYKPVAGKLH